MTKFNLMKKARKCFFNCKTTSFRNLYLKYYVNLNKEFNKFIHKNI